jgi:Tfp pilus assembly protein PilV
VIVVKIVRAFLILRSLWKQQTGFTFNEILVAMSIIMTAILGYSLNTVSVIRGNAANDHATAAINLAQDKMEQLKAQKTLINEDRCPDSGDQSIAATGAPNGIFARCWAIVDSSLGTRLKQITVKVSWLEREKHEITITTLVYEE